MSREETNENQEEVGSEKTRGAKKEETSSGNEVLSSAAPFILSFSLLWPLERDVVICHKESIMIGIMIDEMRKDITYDMTSLLKFSSRDDFQLQLLSFFLLFGG